MGKHRIIILIIFFLEVAFLTFFRNIAGPYVSPVLLLSCSLIIGIYPLYIKFRPQTVEQSEKKSLPLIYKSIILIAVFAGLSIFIASILYSIFKSHPVDAQVSTIIPVLEIMIQRFLNHEFPYKIITEWGMIYPSYMPFQWMPFIFAEIFKIDYRWIAYFFWLSGTLFYAYRLLRKNISVLALILLAALPFAVVYIYIIYVPDTFENTIELMIAGFYMVLCLSLMYDSMFLRSSGIIITLLSRFANFLWIPLYIAITYFAEKKQRAIILTSSILLAVIIFYALPFLSQNFMIFQQGQKAKTKNTIAEWQKPGDKPHELFNGVGVASFFYTFKVGDMTRKVKSLQKLHIIFSILSVLILSIIFLLYQENFDPKMFYLLSLKIHLAIYINFIGIPYVYLFIVPLFVSVVIIGELFSEKSSLT